MSPDLPLPCLVVATSAIRDEGTSYHYLPPGSEVACKSPVVPLLERELITTGWAIRSGKVWTTDAPHRETKVQLDKWAREGVLAVEIQATSLFAFGIARAARSELLAKRAFGRKAVLSQIEQITQSRATVGTELQHPADEPSQLVRFTTAIVFVKPVACPFRFAPFWRLEIGM